MNLIENIKSAVGLKNNALAKVDTDRKLQAELERFAGLVYLVVDCSGSLTDTGYWGQVLDGSRGFIKQALKKGYHVGVIAFSNKAGNLLRPHNNYKIIVSAIELELALGLMNGSYSRPFQAEIGFSGSTNLADAIYMAIENLDNRVKNRQICILTDGTPDDVESALNAAEAAKGKGIGIITIGAGAVNREFLEAIATREELASKVATEKFREGIASMAKLLPER